MRARGALAVVLAALLVVVVTSSCGSGVADQKVIDRLAALDVLTVPSGATLLSRTEQKGGGAAAIRGASSITLVYASPMEPAQVGRDFHARFDPRWSFKDNSGAPSGGWGAIGALAGEQGTVATVEARPAADAGKVTDTMRSLVTVHVSATRPA
ncbi:hypothetical protein ACFQU3_20390 [Terrabacter sp. GCM10028922]|uniref:hypothetical protein n=1 Tax=Terrabacter sp. GCM10028922 TaxID=3273428 RepID=UPI003616F0B7